MLIIVFIFFIYLYIMYSLYVYIEYIWLFSFALFSTKSRPSEINAQQQSNQKHTFLTAILLFDFSKLLREYFLVLSCFIFSDAEKSFNVIVLLRP